MKGAALALALLVACGGSDDDAPTRMTTATPPPADLADAGVPSAPIRPAQPGPPADDEWVDPIPGQPGARTPQPRRPARPTRFIQLNLRSTPPGATVYLDGERVGVTPTFWEGDVDSRARDFTFTRPGHETVRYRFVPITSGTIHPRLKKLLVETVDAGVEAAEPE